MEPVKVPHLNRLAFQFDAYVLNLASFLLLKVFHHDHQKKQKNTGMYMEILTNTVRINKVSAYCSLACQSPMYAAFHYFVFHSFDYQGLFLRITLLIQCILKEFDERGVCFLAWGM